MPRRKKRVTRRRKRPVRRKTARGRRSRVSVVKAKLSGVGLAGLNLGGRVMYCERKAGKKVCFPRQYVKNIKKTKNRAGKTVLTAEIAHSGREFLQAQGRGGTHVMKVRKAKGRRKGGPAWAKKEMKRVAKKCAGMNKKPGTKAWGACIRSNFKKRK